MAANGARRLSAAARPKAAPARKAATPRRPAPGRRPRGGGSRSRPQGRGTTTSVRGSRRRPVTDLVVGRPPPVARLVGALGALAGLGLAGAVVLPYLNIGGTEVRVGFSALVTAAGWLFPVVLIGLGISVALGRLPRLGLAGLSVGGVLAAGLAVREWYWTADPATLPTYHVVGGRRLSTTSIDLLTGWYVEVGSLVLLVVVALAVGRVWPRVSMEDAGGLDPGRPLLGGLGAVAALLAVLALTLPATSPPDVVATDPATGFVTSTPLEGATGLLGRTGWGLTGGLILAIALVLAAAIGSTLRPRLATVGATLTLSAAVLGWGLQGLAEAASSADLVATLGGWSLLVLGLVLLGLTVLAWRWYPRPRPASHGLPMRPAARAALRRDNLRE